MAEIKQIWCGEEQKYYPEIIEENGRTYKLDPTTFVYLEQMSLGLTDEEQELMSEPIGRWGQAWQKFMTENYPEEIPSLQGRLKYAQKNPRPKAFVEIEKWEKTRGFIVEHEVMEQIVLQHRD